MLGHTDRNRDRQMSDRCIDPYTMRAVPKKLSPTASSDSNFTEFYTFKVGDYWPEAVSMWIPAYLSTELKVDHDDRDLWARDDQNDENKKQKSKHIVELVLPDRLHTLQHRHTMASDQSNFSKGCNATPLPVDPSLTHRSHLVLHALQ